MSPSSTRSQSWWHVMLVLVFAELGDSILRSARLFLIEQAICRSYYLTENPALILPGGGVDESQCKDDSLQANVAMVYGTFDVVTLLAGLVATPIYTRLASTVSLRNILFFNLCSMGVGAAYSTAVCYLQGDIRWIWLTGLFDLVGGGQPVRSTLLYAHVAEVVPFDNLSETLYRMSTFVLAVGFSGTLLGATLLNVDVWLLCGIGIAVRVLAIPLTMLFPSRKPDTSVCAALCVGSGPDYGSISSDGEDNQQPSTRAETARGLVVWKQSLSKTFTTLTTEASLSFGLLIELLRSSLTRVTLLIYLFDETAIYVRLAFPQWAAKRFGWTLAEANGITSFQIVVNAAVLLFLPHISRLVLHPILKSQQLVDFFVIKSSLALNIIGIFCAGVAPVRSLYLTSLLVYNLGSALTDALRSFVTSTTRDEEEVQRLYMGITIVESIAGLLGTTLWSSAFSAGIRYGGTTGGRIPFFAAAFLFGLSLWLTGVLHKLAVKRQLAYPEDVDEQIS